MFENELIASLNSGDNESIRKFWRLDRLQDESRSGQAMQDYSQLVDNCWKFSSYCKMSWNSFFMKMYPGKWRKGKYSCLLRRLKTEAYLGNYNCGDTFITYGIPEKNHFYPCIYYRTYNWRSYSRLSRKRKEQTTHRLFCWILYSPTIWGRCLLNCFKLQIPALNWNPHF